VGSNAPGHHTFLRLAEPRSRHLARLGGIDQDVTECLADLDVFDGINGETARNFVMMGGSFSKR
jgi:hypothetical protein